MAVADFNPLDPETVECPYPFYEAMREEAPVHFVPALGFFIVSRYQTIHDVLRDPNLFSSRGGTGAFAADDPELAAISKQGYPQPDTLLTQDPPLHGRYRRLVNRAFSARRVAALEPGIRALVSDLIDGFIADGEIDFLDRFAVPLPVTVIADQLGVSRDDLADFKRWSDDSVAPLGGMITRERRLECARSLVEFQTYFAQRIEERRADPQDDLLSALVNAHLDIDGQVDTRIDGEDDGLDTRPLDVPEMLSILNQILVAGNETTTNLLASALLLLLQNPDQMQVVREDPSAVDGLIEEALRLESPVQGLFRVATADTKLDGVPIPAGSRLVVMYASGNRDDAQFPDAARFDVCRADAATHLAFGGGVHFCLGAALARLEARVAFEELLRRTADIRLVDEQGEFPHTPSFILRGLTELPLRIVPA